VLIFALGFSEATEFSPVLGPATLVVFSAFAQTLLLTILIAILSATFASVQQNAVEAFLFQRAIKTLERVKSEVLHEFLPPVRPI
jgi:regulator of protease activity HflC (stomatin/prohibitin superfamily)